MHLKVHRIPDHQKVWNDLLLAAAAGVFIGFALWGSDLLHPACLFRELTGSSCITCGMSRSLYAFSHGRLIESLRYHPAGPVLFIFASLILMNQSAGLLFRKRITVKMQTRERRILLCFIAGVTLCFWIIRFILEL